MDIDLIFRFLRDLAAHNNREWFAAHRDYYEDAHRQADLLFAAVMARIASFDPSVARLTLKDCTYRIYRDTRFSPDKSPYKRHFGLFVNPHGKNSEYCGYYLHIQPGECLFAGGNYCPPSKLLRMQRQAVMDNIDEFCAIVEDPAFARYFPTVGADFLKSVPKGFPKDFPKMEYLKCKNYEVDHAVPDDFLRAPDFLDRATDILRQMKRFNDFMNYAVADYEQDNELF